MVLIAEALLGLPLGAWPVRVGVFFKSLRLVVSAMPGKISSEASSTGKISSEAPSAGTGRGAVGCRACILVNGHVAEPPLRRLSGFGFAFETSPGPGITGIRRSRQGRCLEHAHSICYVTSFTCFTDMEH